MPDRNDDEVRTTIDEIRTTIENHAQQEHDTHTHTRMFGGILASSGLPTTHRRWAKTLLREVLSLLSAHAPSSFRLAPDARPTFLRSSPSRHCPPRRSRPWRPRWRPSGTRWRSSRRGSGMCPPSCRPCVWVVGFRVGMGSLGVWPLSAQRTCGVGQSLVLPERSPRKSWGTELVRTLDNTSRNFDHSRANLLQTGPLFSRNRPTSADFDECLLISAQADTPPPSGQQLHSLSPWYLAHRDGRVQ